MKKLSLFISLFLVSCCSIFSIASEKETNKINFLEDGPLSEITTVLQSENKCGLLYFRSKTCGWCDKLEKEVFTVDSVINHISSNFVSFKAGENIRKSFKARGVPYIIIIDTNGEEKGRIAGYLPADNFLKKLIESAGGKTISTLKKEFESNPDNNDSAYMYGLKLFYNEDYEKALPVWEDLNKRNFEKSYQNVWKYMNLGTCYENTKQYDKAIEVYIRSLEPGELPNANRKLEACDRLVNLFKTNGDYESVIKYIDIS